tara:strand:+ start:766 stop:1338 length:573 start_codon:yes stop_codon:yes gene_type:complete
MVGKMKIFGVVLLLVVLLGPSPFIFAQQAQGNVVQCMLIETDSERLECYDHLLGRVPSESLVRVDTNPISEPIESPEEVAEETRSEEGVGLRGAQETDIIENPTLRDRFGLKTPAETLSIIDAVVTRVQKNISGMSVFFMADNQVWIQTSIHSQSYPATPFQVEIRRGSMNSYFLAPVNSGLSVRVRRER